MTDRFTGRRELANELTPEAHALSADGELVAGWQRLSEKDREILRLAAWEELDHVELAEVLDCSPGTARVRLHRARERLRVHLRDAGGPVTGEGEDDG